MADGGILGWGGLSCFPEDFAAVFGDDHGVGGVPSFLLLFGSFAFDVEGVWPRKVWVLVIA